jgi:hypothetical protein
MLSMQHVDPPHIYITFFIQVEALGGQEFISSYPLGPIPMPDVNHPPSLEQLCKQVGP